MTASDPKQPVTSQIDNHCMTSIARTVGLLLLLPIAMKFAQYAAMPYAGDPGPLSALLLLYGGYLVLAAFASSFVAIGYQMSKHSVGSPIKAGTLCVVTYFAFQFVMHPIVWILVADISLSVSDFVRQVPSIIAYLAVAFSLGAGGFLLHARVNRAVP